MPRYTAWKTIIAAAERKHRSENATYKHLNEQVATLADGTEITVYVQESGGDRWYTFERPIARGGRLNDA